jgi:2,4-dienoyl-CoA reductase-like NADH-dependent reductase (Old Yellow Enzyme family)
MAFEHLLSPLTLRGKTVRNRILITGHTTGFVDENVFPDARCVAYYRERAKGGAGMLCLGTTTVHPTSPDPHFVYCGYKPGVVAAYKALADGVHEFGSLILVQLGHMGQRDGGLREPIVSASEIAVQAGQSPRALVPEEIEEIIEGFAQAAAYAEEGGLDGVELAVGHGQLINLFLSPLTNQREDEWGGSAERRFRLAAEVIDRVRRRTGPDFIVGARINFDDMVPGGLGEPDWLEISARLAETGQLDFLNVSTDFYSSVVPGMSMPAGGQYVPKTRAIKRATGMPTFTAIRVNQPADADAIIANGDADMVGMTRAHIADPYVGVKTAEGRVDDIRPCVGCLQMCIGELFRERSISCIYNPVSGRELHWAELSPAATPKRIVVVGAGPGGLEAARVAALRGHNVTLFERGPRLGGIVPWIARAPGREEIGNVASWLGRQVEKLPIEVRLNTEATPANVLEVSPHAVILATGSATATPAWFPPEADVPLAGPIDILGGAAKVPIRAVVVDDDGHMEGVSIADYLAANGATVDLITAAPQVGPRIDPGNLEPAYRSLLSRGVTFRTGVRVARVERGALVMASVYTGAEFRLDEPGTIVTTQRFGEDRLWRELRGRVPEIYAVGDCLTPRTIDRAVLEAQTIARAL